MKIIMCLFDSKADMFMTPFFVPTRGVAFRNLSDEIARGGENNILSTHPQDFQLFQLGTFDELAGGIDSSRVELVCEVSSLILGEGNVPQ